MVFRMGMAKRVASVAALGVLGVTAAVGTGVLSPAHAASGRRFCVYANDSESVSGTTNFVLVNYKKTGGCPAVDSQKWSAHAVVGKFKLKETPDKITCEEAPGVLGGNPYGSDVDMCTRTDVDKLYVFSKVGDQAVGAPQDAGSVWDITIDQSDPPPIGTGL